MSTRHSFAGLAVVAAVVSLTSCSGSEGLDDVGGLKPVAGGGQAELGSDGHCLEEFRLRRSGVDNLASPGLETLRSVKPSDLGIAGGDGAFLAGPNETLWLQQPDDCPVLQISNNDVTPIAELGRGRVGEDSLWLGSDGVFYYGHSGLLHYHSGQVDNVGDYDGVKAVGQDGTIYTYSPETRQLESAHPDGTRQILLDEIDIGPLVVAPNGMIYFSYDRSRVEGEQANWIRSLAPDGTVRRVVGGGTEGPKDGNKAAESQMSAHDMVATDDGLYVVDRTTETSGTESVWLIRTDGRLDLIFRRTVGGPGIDLISALKGRVYVTDSVTHTISEIVSG